MSNNPTSIELAFSTCPNDTFMFHGLVSGEVVVPELSFTQHLDDIEGLNKAVVEGPGPAVSKLSVAAYAHVADRYRILDSGAALGRGCGPLVVQPVGAEHRELGQLRGARVAIPGQLTTAYLLFRIFGPQTFVPVVMRFDEIMPAVQAGEVDAGLIIHEGRFTYRNYDLRIMEDLGERWEATTGLPLALGVIAARRDLGASVAQRVEAGLRRSIEGARRDSSRAWPWIMEHAQEMEEQVCREHISLYVNEFSLSLGEEGRRAIVELLQRGRSGGVVPELSRAYPPFG